MIRPAILALALLAAPLPAAADPAETARAAALQMLQAVEGLAAANTARDRVAALTATIAAHETGLTALRSGLREASLREAEIARALDRQSETVGRLLAAMMAIGRVEGPALLIHPAGPLGTARAGMMTADLAPAMQAEADRLAAVLAELRELRIQRAAAVQALQTGLTSLQDARADLGQAISERRPPAPELSFDEARLLALLESAATLDSLAAGLAALPPGAPLGAGDFAAAQGTLRPPVRGTLLRRAGEADAAGTARPGIVLATEPGALAVAPWDVSVRYRGPLLDYGNVILLEPAEDYLILVAGLGTVYPELGEVLAAGAPLGLMPGADAQGAEFAPAVQAGVVQSESLYLELRHRGRPIDPGGWFALNGPAP